MTRRKALAILAVLASPMAQWRGVSAEQQPKALPVKPAWLTIDLNHWAGMTVKLQKEEIHFTSKDILELLKEL